VIREYHLAGFDDFTTKKVKKSDGIRLVRNMLQRGEIAFNTEHCDILPKRIADYRYPTDEDGNVKGDEPVKNKATHLCDALRYGMTGVFPVDDLLYDGLISESVARRVPDYLGPSGAPIDRHLDGQMQPPTDDEGDIFTPMFGGHRETVF
jgi:hypothetical protein